MLNTPIVQGFHVGTESLTAIETMSCRTGDTSRIFVHTIHTFKVVKFLCTREEADASRIKRGIGNGYTQIYTPLGAQKRKQMLNK